MNKEELLKQLKKENESTVAKLNPTTIGTYAHGMGYSDGLKYAVDLTEELDEPSAQKTSDMEIKNCLSYAGYADLAYNERVINGIESVLIQLGYEVEDD
jgi:hypothetical protein